MSSPGVGVLVPVAKLIQWEQRMNEAFQETGDLDMMEASNEMRALMDFNDIPWEVGEDE